MKKSKYFRLNESQLKKLEKLTITLFKTPIKNKAKAIEQIVNEEFEELNLKL